MANKTFNTRVKNKRDTAANWEAVATTFQPLDGELIIVDTAAGKTRFKVGRYDTAKGRLLYYNEIPFTDEYLYNDLNESQGKIYDKLKGIDDKSIIEMTLESVFDNTKFVNYRIGLWQFSKTGFYKLNIPKRGTTATQLFVYAQKTKEDGTTPEDPFSQDNLLRISALNGDRQVESVLAQVDYTDTDTLTVYKVQFLNAITFPGTLNVNAYNKTTQKWDFTSVTESSAKWANNATQVSNAITLTKGDTTTKFDGSSAQTVSIPTKTSELTNDSDFTTQTDLDNLTNTVVSYNAQENITDEQKAQARTNIGAISSDELVQADWNQNDPDAKDYIKNKFGCYTVVTSETSREILQKSGTFVPLLGLVLGETYNINYSTNSGTEPSGEGANYVCKDLHDTVSSAPVGTLYVGDINSDGSSNGYTIYEDHIELNSGFSYMVNPQRWKITGNLNEIHDITLPEKYFPQSLAKTYIQSDDGENISLSTIKIKNSAATSLPGEVYLNGEQLLVNKHYENPENYVGSATWSLSNISILDKLFNEKDIDINETISENYTATAVKSIITQISRTNKFGIIKVEFKDVSMSFIVTDSGLYAEKSGNSYFSRYHASAGVIPVAYFDSNDKRITQLFSVDFLAFANADSVYIHFTKVLDNTHLITTSKVDTALSPTSENPVQNKVVKEAIDDLQASIDSKSMDKITNGDVTLACGGEDGTEYLHLTSTTDAGCESDFYGNSIYQYLYETDNGSAPALYYYSKSQEKILGGLSVTQNYTNGKHGIESLNLFTTDGRIDVASKYSLTLQTTDVGNIIVRSEKPTNKFDVQIPSTVLAPTDDMNPATKKYVDDQMTTVNNQLGGLTGAMHFIGKAAVDITDGSTTDPQIANYTTKEKGDVILGKDDHKEFVWNGAIWEELGDEGSYALKTTTINGKALSDNITLTASDVGAASASTIETMQAAIDSKPSAADAVYTATAASTDGVAYTATVSGIDSLTVGASFIMIPNKASTSKAPTLNVNGLGAKPIRRRLSSLTTSLQQGYSTNWIALNKPFTVVYDGTAWVIEGLTKTDGADVYGAVAQATADAKGNNIADTYATIAMLQSLLPKVTTITLTSNWVGDASPYYQDIALSCVTETSIVDLQPTPEQLNSWQDDGLAFTTLSGNGTVRVYVAGGKPSSAISVQVRVQEVTVI